MFILEHSQNAQGSDRQGVLWGSTEVARGQEQKL